MLSAFRNYWKKAFDFRGTADIKTFWLTLGGCYVGYLACAFPLILAYAGVLLLLKNTGALPVVTPQTILAGVLAYTLLYLVPMPALTVRRVRDARQPWWLAVLLLLGFPVLGFGLIGLLRKKPEDAISWGRLTRAGYYITFAGASVLLWGMSISMLSRNPEGFVGLFGVGMVLCISGVAMACVGLEKDRLRAAQRDHAPAEANGEY